MGAYIITHQMGAYIITHQMGEDIINTHQLGADIVTLVIGADNINKHQICTERKPIQVNIVTNWIEAEIVSNYLITFVHNT